MRSPRFQELDEMIAAEPPEPEARNGHKPVRGEVVHPNCTCGTGARGACIVHSAKPTAAPPKVQLTAQPGIVIWGRMNEACDLLSKSLKHLPRAEDDYHGTLLHMLAEAQGLESDIRLLLKMRDEKGEF
jgi:hypothetical protein